MTSLTRNTHAADYPMYVHIEAPLVDQDAPTAADCEPFAMAQAAEAIESGRSYGELWKAYVHDASFYLEM